MIGVNLGQEGGVPVSRSRSCDLEYSSACQRPLPLFSLALASPSKLVPCDSPSPQKGASRQQDMSPFLTGARTISPEGRAKVDDGSADADESEWSKWTGSVAGQKLLITPDLHDRPMQVSKYDDRGPVPRAIAFDSSLPVVKEIDDDQTSQTSDALQLQKVRQDVDELSIDVSAFESNKSMASAMTRESCVELAERLERLQNDLLCLAGDDANSQSRYTKSDAMRALAKAAHHQARKSKHLSKEVKALRKTNNKLASELFEATESNRNRWNANLELTEQLNQTRTKTADLESTVTMLKTKLNRLETENVDKTRQLMQSWNSRTLSHRPSSPTVQENQYCDEIRMLKEEMARMEALHRAKEKRSTDKIAILNEIKHGLLEKIRYLEEEDDDQESSE